MAERTCTSVPYEIYVVESADHWYVGSTTRGFERRFRMHMAGYGGAPLLRQRVGALGERAFSVRRLESSVGDPMPAEQAWYDWHLANDSRSSLNTRRPGAFPAHTDVTRAKISAAKSGIPSPMKGRTFPSSVRDRMRASSPHAAKTHCAAGHPLDGDNLYLTPRGWRRCRTCRMAEQEARSPEAKAAKKRADVARRKERYATDPAYRSRILEYNKANRDQHREGVTRCGSRPRDLTF